MPAPVARADFRRLLVPPTDLTVGDGWTVVEEQLRTGIPHSVTLTGDFALLLVVPTGTAAAWRDAPATAVVSSSHAGLAARPRARASDGGTIAVISTGHVEAAAPTPAPAPPHAPARLVLLRAGRPTAAVALTAAGRVVLPEHDPVPGVRVELLVREWDIRAGSLRGPGDVGSRISLAWRRVDAGTPAWTPPRPAMAPSPAAAGDDLERLEGVGPVFAAVLRAAGLTTFRAIADAGTDRLRGAIGRAGWSFAPNLRTWSQQAGLLADGDVAGFEALVARLTAGRRR